MAQARYEPRYEPRYRFLILLVLLAAFVAVLGSQVRATRSDPYGLLMVAQAIIDHGSIRLDDYDAYFRDPDGQLKHVAVEINGHLYHYFPVGVPVVSIPAVALANALGFHVQDFDTLLQRLMSAISAVVVILIYYSIARLYFQPVMSCVISLLGFFGTIVAPTMGSALWSINYEIIFIGLAVLLLLRHARGESASWHPWALGLVLFLAYLVRPTAAVFIFWVLAYLLVVDRRMLLVVAGLSGSLFLAFLGWSHHEFGTLLPPYYSVERLSPVAAIDSLQMVLLSCSRNIFIWNPFLILLPLLAWRAKVLTWPKLRVPLLLALTAGGLFLVNILTPQDGGPERGWSYGPRIYTTMAFVFLLLSICLVGEITAMERTVRKKLGLLPKTLLATLALGMFVNLPGLYNTYTWYWNVYPNIGDHVEVVYDWRFPQFLVTRASLVDKYETQSQEFNLPTFGFVPLRGTLLLVGPASARSIEPFRVTASDQPGQLTLLIMALGAGELSVSVNDQVISVLDIAKPASSLVLEMPRRFLDTGSENRITFSFAAERGASAAMVSFSLRL